MSELVMTLKPQKIGLQKNADLEQIETLKEAHYKIIKQIENIIIGQHHIIDELLIALFPTVKRSRSSDIFINGLKLFFQSIIRNGLSFTIKFFMI